MSSPPESWLWEEHRLPRELEWMEKGSLKGFQGAYLSLWVFKVIPNYADIKQYYGRNWHQIRGTTLELCNECGNFGTHFKPSPDGHFYQCPRCNTVNDVGSFYELSYWIKKKGGRR